MNLKRTVVILLFLPCGLYLIGFCPIPFEQIVKEETSPDGSQIAQYSWKPCGLFGVITQDNPWVYLTIREKSSGRVLSRYSTWGDMPNDGEIRLSSFRPW